MLGNLGRRRGKRLQRGDVIIAVDSARRIRNTSEFYAYIMKEKRRGSKLALTVLRGGERIRVEVPVVQ